MEKSHLTRNGIKIYGYKNTAQHGFFISLFVKAGSMYESERDSGITHFFEHISIRNVSAVMDGGLYAALDREGVEFNASTYAEMVQFYVSGASEKFAFGAEVITKLFSPIALPKSEIDAERRRIKAEIRESDDKNSLLSFTNDIVHKDTSLCRPITGTLSGVDRINGKRLEEYRRRTLTKDNLFFYLTGNYTEEDLSYLSSLIESCDIPESCEIRGNEAPLSQGHFHRQPTVAVKSGSYTAVRFTFDLDMKKLSVPVTDLIYDILLSGYNSRFFIELSEKRGLFYDLTGAVERYKNLGELYFSYELRSRDIYTAVSETVSILNEFKKELIPEDALMRCGYVDNAYMLYDDARELNFTYAYDNHVMDLGYGSVEERKRAYESLTSADVLEAAREIFRAENLTLTVKGDKKKIDTEELLRIVKGLSE